MMFMYNWNRITWRYNLKDHNEPKPQEQQPQEQPQQPQPNEDLEYLETRIERWENADD